MIAVFNIRGTPVTKKNSNRIWRRGRKGKPFVMPSAQVVAWTHSAVLQMQSQWRQGTIESDVNVSALVYRKRRTGDLNNYLAAIADALEKAAIVKNDKQIVAWDGSRLLKDADNPRVELTIGVVP